jgi:hypothetical protein
VTSDKIKVTCHGCGARYQVRATKVRGHRFRATCKKCGGIIVAHCSNAFTVMPDRGSGGGVTGKRPSQRSPMQLSHDELRTYQEEDEPTWYVVIGGKPHGPMSTMQLRTSFEAGRVSERSYLWRAGDPEWRRLGEVPEFMDLTADAEHTGYYQPEEETGETRAAGPKGIRKQAGVIASSTPGLLGPEGETTFYQANPEVSDSEAQATKFHFRPEEEAGGPVPQPGQEAWNQPQPAAWQMPVIPPRKAILPSPTGAPRAPTYTTHPGRPSMPAASSPDFTRPLSDSAKAQAVKSDGPTASEPLNLLPSLAPSPIAQREDLPPPPESVFSQSLKPIGPPAGPALLAPAEEPFWTTGKIAAAAAIGGGLAVAMAVVVVVSVVRPKPKPVVAQVTRKEAKATKARPAETNKARAVKKTPAKEPSEGPAKTGPAKTEPAKTKPPAKTGPAKTEPAKTEPAKTEPAKTKPPAKARRKRATRVSLRKKPPRRKRPSPPKRKPHRSRGKKKGLGNEVDDLLDSAASGKASKASKDKGPSVDADALLAAGTGKKKKAGGPSADDLLNVRTKPKPKPTKKSRPSQAEIQAAMRRVISRVRGCFDKYKIAGRADVTITLRPDGTFDARIVGQFAGTPTGYCVLAGVNKARFPPFSGVNPIRFTYPFHLK